MRSITWMDGLACGFATAGGFGFVYGGLRAILYYEIVAGNH